MKAAIRVLLVLGVLAATLAPVTHAAEVKRTPRGPVVTYTETIEAEPVEEGAPPTDRVVKATLRIAVRRIDPRRIAYDLRVVLQLQQLPRPEEPAEAPTGETAEEKAEREAEEKAEREGTLQFRAYTQACGYRLNRDRDGIGRIILGLGENGDAVTLRGRRGRLAGRVRGEATLRNYVMPPNPYRRLRIRAQKADAVCFGLDQEPGEALLPAAPADPDPGDVKRAETRPAPAEGEGGGEAPH